MRVWHASIRLRKFILVCWLPFLLWQLFHYFAWVISEPSYEKFLIQGTDSLLINCKWIIIKSWFFIFYIDCYTYGFPMKDLNGMEFNRWQKLTQKTWTISTEMIANVSANATANAISILNSNVLADGKKISHWRSTNHSKICE